jgi:hypothetical protein
MNLGLLDRQVRVEVVWKRDSEVDFVETIW